MTDTPQPPAVPCLRSELRKALLLLEACEQDVRLIGWELAEAQARRNEARGEVLRLENDMPQEPQP